MTKSNLEDLLAVHMANDGLEPVREYRFGEGRHRFDFAWPDLKMAAEVEGGTWAGGRHSTGKGFAADCRKYNAAALAGWRVFRFTGDQVRSGYARGVLSLAVRLFGGRGAK